MNSIDFCLILLTYKGKILLLQQNSRVSPFSYDSWHFIGKTKEKNKSIEQTITHEVERETHITPESINLILSLTHEDRMEYVFHAKLTDKNVNSIYRGDGHILQFFRLNELKKLKLHKSTQAVISEYNSLLEKLIIN